MIVCGSFRITFTLTRVGSFLIMAYFTIPLNYLFRFKHSGQSCLFLAAFVTRIKIRVVWISITTTWENICPPANTQNNLHSRGVQRRNMISVAVGETLVKHSGVAFDSQFTCCVCGAKCIPYKHRCDSIISIIKLATAGPLCGTLISLPAE